MNRLALAVVTALSGALLDVGHAQVACGDPNVFLEVIPAVAAPGQPIEIRLTNNTTGSIGVPDGCTYVSIHVADGCSVAGAIATNFACQGQTADVPAGTSTSGFWDQKDDFGVQQVPGGVYWASVFYFKGGQGFGECCVPFTISTPLATYCTAKSSFIGCSAAISTTDPNAQPVSGQGGYGVTARFVEGQRSGLLFASPSGPAATPFLGGFLCVQQPLKRGLVQNSGGQALSCTGTLSGIVNDGVSFPAGFDPGPGNSAWYQFWHRIGGVGNVGLSNAVRLDFQ